MWTQHRYNAVNPSAPGSVLTFGETMPVPTPLLTFEQWLHEHQEELRLQAYELGPELYDFEHFAIERYQDYCNRCSLAA